MNDGHVVAGIDGLKIEPLPADISGVRPDGSRVPFMPVRDVRALYDALDERVMAGFGGVAEYGITVRWDKNFLKLIRLLLERRTEFALFGGVRFGGTVTLDDALAAGFDHVALCMGAGKPTTLEIPHGLARGVRTASDFLMALQLTGAAKENSLANMELRLPVVVIGGGLTAIDTATESAAYYVVQVAKFLHRYETLAREIGEDAIRDRWQPEEREIAEEFLSHARAIAAERAAAKAQGRAPRIIELLQSWGGVTIAYRRRLIDSPSYTLNHEEVGKALEEGIVFAEGLTPLAIEVDDYGDVSGIRFRKQHLGEDGTWQDAGEHRLPAETIFVAAGTQPNTVLAREDPTHFALDGKYFQACDEAGDPVRPQVASTKPERADVLLSRTADGRFLSFFGDLHPSYFGNVVKALGSTRQGYPAISRVLGQRRPASALDDATFLARLNRDWRATVHAVNRLTPTIVEVVMRAPAAARNFRPGQFYRLQNYETLAPTVAGTRMQMEGLALTGAWVDPAEGLVSTIVLEMGGSSDLCARIAPWRAGGVDGADWYADSYRTERDCRASWRWPRQCGLVLHRLGVSCGRLARALLRGLQEDHRPLQGGGHRSRRGCGRVVLRRGAGVQADSCAGPLVHRQHRPGHAGVCCGPPRRATDPHDGCGPHHRHRLGPYDGCRSARSPRRARVLPQGRACGDRLDQLADAVHDEGDLRPVPAAAS